MARKKWNNTPLLLFAFFAYAFPFENANAEEGAVTVLESAFFKPSQEHPIPPLSLDPESYFTTPLLKLSSNTHTQVTLKAQDQDTIQDKVHPCHPRQVHLSLGNRQATNIKTSMTVSFSIPFRLDEMCHPNNIQLYVKYGRVGDEDKDETLNGASMKEYIAFLHGNEDEYLNSSSNKQKMRQYNATSPATNEYFMSDFIYHVPLENLDPEIYWYSIHVESIDKLNNKHVADYPWVEEGSKEKEQSIAIQRHLRGVRVGDGGSGGTSGSTSMSGTRSWSVDSIEASIFSIATKRNTFTTKTTSSSPTQFAIVGDLGQTYNSTVTMLHILSEIDQQRQQQQQASEIVMLCAGDMSYANSIQPQWDNWFELMEPVIATIPLMVAVGNHEIECDALTDMPFAAYESRFFMPNRINDAIIQPVRKDEYDQRWGCATPSVFEGDYDYGNAFYSFERDLVKVIVLSSYSDTSVHSNQYNFLWNELKSVDRTKTPWVMVMMHSPFYNTFDAHNNERQSLDMQASMESLFRDYGVNIVLSGHVHAYMRSKPMYKGQVDESGKSPIYMIVGEGGNREGHVQDYLLPDPEPWVAVRDKSVYGFGMLNVMNATTAHWKWNMNGREDAFKDDVWITNQFL